MTSRAKHQGAEAIFDFWREPWFDLETVGPLAGIRCHRPCFVFDWIPIIQVRGFMNTSRTVRWSLDVLGALAGLLLLAPMMLAIGLLIRLESPGPILSRQLRRGYRGRLFWVLKFRTMVGDAEQVAGLAAMNGSSDGASTSGPDGPGVTPLGRFLQRSALDGVPQLINVLRGEMSLIGPRPLSLAEADRLQSLDPEGYLRCFRSPSGLPRPCRRC